MPHGRRPLWLLATLALAGCVQAGPVRAPETSLPPSFEAEAGRAALAIDRWWLLFGDTQLTGLVEAALARSTDIRLAAARLQEARAIRRGALTPFNPQGDLRANAQAQGTEVLAGGAGSLPGVPGGEQGGNPFLDEGIVYSGNVGFDVSWEVDVFGRRGAARREAEATLVAARFNYEGTRASIAANVADALFAIRGQALQLVDARETLRIQSDVRDVTQVRARRGLAAQSDVARLEAEIARTVADITRLEGEQQANRRALLVLTGDAVAPTTSVPIAPMLASLPETPAALPSELLARRPDVREAQARLNAAAGRLRLDELAFFPRFTLNPGIGLSAQSGGFVDALSAVWTLAAGLTAPILDRPRLVAQLRTQEARVEQAVVGYERAVQTAFSEADQTLVRLAADRRQVAQLQAGQARASEAYRAARTLYDRGLTDLPALLDSERAFRASRSAVITAQVQALRRAVQVFKALGGGWDSSAAPAPAAANGVIR